MRAVLFAMAVFAASSASAQHYENFEVRRSPTGGYTGTLGNRNFDIDKGKNGSGQIGGQRPGVVEQRPARKKGNVGATQRNCVVDAKGVAYCR